MGNEWSGRPVPQVDIPHDGLSYACEDCGAVFPVDPADPFDAHGQYLDHLEVHEADENEQMPVMTRHGYGAYTNGCRCEVCRRAKAAYMRLKRAAEPTGHVEGITHGYAGYQDYKCRCDICRTAKYRADKQAKLRWIEASRG